MSNNLDSFSKLVEVVEVLNDFRVDLGSNDEIGDYEALAEELGDVLLQVLLHSQIASEKGKFTIDDVVNGLNEKLVRRHPHVFGESDATTIEEAELQWERIKSLEKTMKGK